MNKNLIFEQNLASDKVAYEKPTSQVYELEVEGAILQASTDNPKVADYEYDSRGVWN